MELKYYAGKDVLDALLDCMERISKQDGADVVKVVRCKDCKLWSSSLTKEEKQVLIDTNTDGVCEVWMSDGLMPNDFCSYGQRKEDEGSDG